MDEPDRSSTPPSQADEHPPRGRTNPPLTCAIDLDVHDASGTLPPDELGELRSMCRRVLALLPNAGSVRVRIVDDEEMIRAHQRFSGSATTTDVLTFDLADPAAPPESKALAADRTICSD